MSIFRHLNLREELVYAFIWLLVFLFPLVTGHIHQPGGAAGGGIPWHDITVMWRFVALFLAAFIVHDLLVAPRLVWQRRLVPYLLQAVLLLALFAGAHTLLSRHLFNGAPRHVVEFPMRAPNAMHDGPRKPVPDDGRPRRPHRGPRMGGAPFLLIVATPREVSAILTMVLLFGINIAVKFTFRSTDEQQRISQLERRNLEQQLQYLKYQINPHFFMNTLNNIHALVDIDPEQAKSTIVLLSKMMRYVLYDGERPLIDLRREADFIGHYVQLMSIRYSSNVSVTTDFPDELPQAQVPPLLLVTFVENAFKHGVSATAPSDIVITLAEAPDGGIDFRVDNTLHPAPAATAHQAAIDGDRRGGVGLRNALERLRLIYGKAYTYAATTADGVYTASLHLPLQPDRKSVV